MSNENRNDRYRKIDEWEILISRFEYAFYEIAVARISISDHLFKIFEDIRT